MVNRFLGAGGGALALVPRSTIGEYGLLPCGGKTASQKHGRQTLDSPKRVTCFRLMGAAVNNSRCELSWSVSLLAGG